MSKWDKLLTRICALSKDLRFDELRKVLESYGYVMNAPKGGSSHYTFRKAGCQPITIPKHEPIKKVYVEMVKQIVESEAVNDENAGNQSICQIRIHAAAIAVDGKINNIRHDRLGEHDVIEGKGHHKLFTRFSLTRK